MPTDTRPQRFWTSVRVRITVGATLVVALLLGGVSVLLVLFQLNSALGHLDEMLSDEAEAIGLSIGTGTNLPMLFDDDRVLIVNDADGNVVMSAGDYEELEQIDVVTEDDRGIDIHFSGQLHRVVSEPFLTGDGRWGWVVLAEPRDELDDSVDRLIRSLAITVPGTLLALTAMVWFLVGRTLRPVEQMRRQVASIGIAELDRRVPEPPSDDEIARLAATMNRMLTRLEQSVRRQQRFVADASHELRTPLTRMRARLEVDRHHPDAADREATLSAELDDVRALQAMIDDLLLLAKSDAGVEPGPRDLIDLDDLVIEELAAADIAHEVDASGVSAAQVYGSPEPLRRVVRNLLDNADRFASSRIDVALEEVAGEAVLTIDDDGPGIPADRRAEMLERFTRLDGSRTGIGHAGLGLSIVAEVVFRHHGSVELLDSPLGGTRAQVRLPQPRDS
jgi:signal transduction histidine kinase